MRRLRQLEAENARLKKLVAERDLEIEVMKVDRLFSDPVALRNRRYWFAIRLADDRHHGVLRQILLNILRDCEVKKIARRPHHCDRTSSTVYHCAVRPIFGELSCCPQLFAVMTSLRCSSASVQSSFDAD